VVAAHLRPTPLVPLELPGGAEVLAKLDSLQPTGSFKLRGALAALAALPSPGASVVTASAGNHALALVEAARRLGSLATVVVPRTASQAKLAALRRRHADLVVHGDDYDQAERHALELAEAGGAYVSAYNDPNVIAGQGTWVAEEAERLPGGATLVVPVGGGGLLAGTLLWAAGRPDLRVVGVEAAASMAVSAALAAGRVVAVPVAPTLADGLAGNLEAGSVTPGLARGRVHAMAAVTEEEIERAVRFLLAAGLVVEGSGAVGVAALLAGRLPLDGPTVVLLTGRNIAAAALARILGRGDLDNATNPSA
jgi:threonine dehydratase